MRSVGSFGITGLDKLLCFMMVRDLGDLVNKTKAILSKSSAGKILRNLVNTLNPTTAIPENADTLYKQALKAGSKLWHFISEAISSIGQKQLLRRLIAALLKSTCKLDSNLLYCALETLNKALITDIRAHYRNPETKPYPGGEENPLLSELAKYLEHTGVSDPFTKIYITTDPIEDFAVLVFLLVVSQTKKYIYNSKLGILIPKTTKNSYDSIPFLVGVITLLKQFHSINTQKFLAYLGQYVRANITEQLKSKEKNKEMEYPVQVINVLLWLEDYCKYTHLPRKVVEGYVPAYIFDHFSHESKK